MRLHFGGSDWLENDVLTSTSLTLPDTNRPQIRVMTFQPSLQTTPPLGRFKLVCDVLCESEGVEGGSLGSPDDFLNGQRDRVRKLCPMV